MTARAVAVEEEQTAGELLQVCRLQRSFGGVAAVVDASFTVLARGITGLIGPNGAGKTTTIGMIAGDIRPGGGQVRFRGQDITQMAAHQRARAGLIRTFQISSEFRKLTVLENLIVAIRGPGETVLGALLRPRKWRAYQDEAVVRAGELLQKFDLSDQANTRSGELSGGQKRLLEIARGLMAGPRLLVLDEPMAGVNPQLKQRIESHLLDLRDNGLAILMVEHDLPVVERCCDRVIVMARGANIAEGTMADIRASEEVKHAYLA